jgi:hypothetical protein
MLESNHFLGGVRCGEKWLVNTETAAVSSFRVKSGRLHYT